MEKLTNRHENEKVKLDVIALFELNQKFKRIEADYKKKKERLTTNIKNFMFVNKDVKSIKFLAQSGEEFSKENKTLEVKKINPIQITWIPEKLEEKLDPEIASEIIQKTYEINDMDGLIKYLKTCGVSPKIFKSFLNIKKSVNVEAMNQLEEIGDISHADVKGCYTIKESAAYLKINILEDE